MHTNIPPDAKSLFGRALEISDHAERAAYLDGACASPEIRVEVAELLALHEQAGGFLRHPAVVRMDATAAYEPLLEGPGTRVGPYKLLQEIGEGGMGTVFMAEQEEPVRRKVALKIIKPGMDSKQVVARFEAERQALSMMDHPNIAKVLDAGTTASGRPYFVMELVHGVPITEFCDANKLTPQERLALFIPVCQAIQHAHMKGIIHRDIKPSNVLVTMYDDKPVPKVIDFGVAKAVEQRLTERTLFTQYGALVGTFEYMSPEQAEMNAFGVDTRSDVYSLGVLLYELLTGSTPLERGQLRTAALGEVVRLIKEEEPPRPSQRISTSGTLAKVAAARKMEPGKLSNLVRGELDWIVMRCLEKDRTRRYESATGLAKDVERYLTGEAVEACPPTLGYRLKKTYRRNRAAVLVTSGFLGLVLGAAVLSSLLAVQARRAGQIAEKNAKEAEIARDAEVERRAEAERLGTELRLSNYQASIRLAAASIERGEVGVARDLLDRTRPRAGEEDLRGFEWHYLRRQLNSETATILEASPEFAPRDCAYSPDGRSLGIGCEYNGARASTSTVQLRDVAEKRMRWTIPLRGSLNGNLAFTPDGNHITCTTFPDDLPRGVTGSDVWVIDVRKAEARKLLRLEDKYAYATAISPDGQQLAVFHKVSSINLGFQVPGITTYEIATGKVVSTATAPEGTSDGHLAYDTAGRLLAAWVKENTVILWDCDAGAQRAVIDLRPTASNIRDVRLSARAASIIVGSSDKKVRAWDLTGDKPTLQSMFEVDAIGPGTQLHLSADGRYASTTDFIATQVVSVWDVRTGRRVLAGRGHSQSVVGFGFSPDGRTVASTSNDGSVKLWSLPSDKGPQSEMIAMIRFRNNSLFARPDGGFSALTNKVDTGEKDSDFQIVDVATGRVLSSQKLSGSLNRNLSPDGRWVLTPTGQRIFQIIEVTTGQRAPGIPPEGIAMTRGTFLTNETLYIETAERKAEILNVTTGRRYPSPYGDFRFTHLTASGDGSRVAVVRKDFSVQVLDAKSGAVIHSPESTLPLVPRPLLNADGTRLALMVGNEAIVYDLANGVARRFRGHSGVLSSVQFSPDRRRLFTAAQDLTVRVWDIASGAELLSIRADAEVRSAAVSRDGHRLAIQTWTDGHGKIFDATPLAETKK